MGSNPIVQRKQDAAEKASAPGGESAAPGWRMQLKESLRGVGYAEAAAQLSGNKAAPAPALQKKGAPEPAAKDPAAQKREIAEAIVTTGGTGAASDKAVVVTEMLKIPLGALQALKKKGMTVVVCKNSVTEIKTELKGVRPRGWPAGHTWDSVPGLYDRANKRVIIATRGGKVPANGDGHGAHNLVLHEVAHAIDAAGGGSDSKEFKAARDKDKGTLSAYESQAGAAGREETYAESFARYHGGDAGDKKAHPNLNAYWATNPLDSK